MGNDMDFIYLNGKFYRKNEAKVSVFDHGLLYGDGIFETLRAYDGIVFKIDEHLDRLFHSAKLIDLKIPLTKYEIKKAIYLTLRKNKLNDAYIRVTISRGEGKLGYLSKCVPNIVVIAQKFIPYPKRMYEKGISAATCNAERILPEVKSTSCLPLVVARLKTKGYFEAFLVDSNANITEGTISNIFFVKGNILYTPKENILWGITREIIVKIAKKIGIQIKEARIKKSGIYLFKESFLANTLAEIMPVVEINDKKIGNGLPGPMTKRLIGEFKKERDLWLKKNSKK